MKYIKYTVSVLFVISFLFLTNCIAKEESSAEKKELKEDKSKPVLIFEAEWNKEIGYHEASGEEGDVFNFGFKSFFVLNNIVFIADPIEEQISLFEGNRFVGAFSYPTRQDEGMVAAGNYVYLLDSLGRMNKIDTNTGEVEEERLVIREKYGVVPQFKYIVYVYQDAIVIDNHFEKEARCISMSSLIDSKCPFSQIENRNIKYIYYYLPNGKYAILKDYDAFWLYDEKGREIGVVKGVFDNELLYMMRSYQATKDGVYYVVQSKEGAKIYFKPWSKP